MLRKVISGTEKLPPSLILKKLIGINILSLMVRPSLSRLSCAKEGNGKQFALFFQLFFQRLLFNKGCNTWGTSMQIWQIPICNRSRDTIWRFAVKIQYENHLKANFSVKNCLFCAVSYKILYSFDFFRRSFILVELSLSSFSFPSLPLPLLSYISICLTFFQPAVLHSSKMAPTELFSLWIWCALPNCQAKDQAL